MADSKSLQPKKTSNALDKDALFDYANWIGKTPVEILIAVRRAGGWQNVFPLGTKFPVWASRIRNYFNKTPINLSRTLTDPFHGSRFTHVITTAALNYQGTVTTAGGVGRHSAAFSGDVYVDDDYRQWFQLHPAGNIYHYIKRPNKIRDGALAAAYGQEYSPVFKLISFDGTGGSMELIVKNKYGDVAIGQAEYIWTNVTYRTEKNEIFRGSYNYADATLGAAEHERCDVETHNPREGFYINPPEGSALKDRRFPDLEFEVDKLLNRGYA